MRTELVVALGDETYAVERPWGAVPERMRLGGVAAVAVDSGDRVFVLQRRDPPVVVFDRHGTYLRSWGTGVILDGSAISIGPDDRVLVADRDAHQILVFDGDGTLQSALGERHRPRFNAPFNHPAAATFAPGGDIYVADGYGNACVHWFGSDGELRRTWGSPGSGPGELVSPLGIAVDREGRVLVVDAANNRVQVFTAEGDFVAEWTDFWRPLDVWVDPAGLAYVTDQIPRLSLHAADGALLGRCRPVFYTPLTVRGDSRGDLYFAEGPVDRVSKLVRLPAAVPTA